MSAQIDSQIQQNLDFILDVRRARAASLGWDLFTDPAWDILLELYAAGMRREKLRLCDFVTTVPQSTLARWASVLQERGLITCDLDASERAVLRLELSATGEAKMSELLRSLRQRHLAD